MDPKIAISYEKETPLTEVKPRGSNNGYGSNTGLYSSSQENVVQVYPQTIKLRLKPSNDCNLF